MSDKEPLTLEEENLIGDFLEEFGGSWEEVEPTYIAITLRHHCTTRGYQGKHGLSCSGHVILRS
jgi:hypothetical protein